MYLYVLGFVTKNRRKFNYIKKQKKLFDFEKKTPALFFENRLLIRKCLFDLMK